MDKSTTLTFKVQGLYVAFAPQFEVSAYGDCQDEANKQVFSESNTVKLPGGSIDVAASHAKRLVTKAAILSSKK